MGAGKQCSQVVIAWRMEQATWPAGCFLLQVQTQEAVGQLQQRYLHILGNAKISSERGQQPGGECLPV